MPTSAKSAKLQPSDNLWRLLGSVGVAAAITSGLGLASNVITSSRDQRSRQCEVAGQLLTDDKLNEGVMGQRREALVAEAATRVDKCLKELL